MTEFIDVYGLIYVTSGSTFCLQFFIFDCLFSFGQNEVKFAEADPEHQKGITALLKAIWKAGIARKSIILRKCKSPEADD